MLAGSSEQLDQCSPLVRWRNKNHAIDIRGGRQLLHVRHRGKSESCRECLPIRLPARENADHPQFAGERLQGSRMRQGSHAGADQREPEAPGHSVSPLTMA